MTISAFFDESGKFQNQSVISFGGVTSDGWDFAAFGKEWDELLHVNGLESLTMKEVLKAHLPLSASVEALGTNNRVSALLPFISCIRKHLQCAAGMALDANTFKALPSHYFQALGDNPFFISFARILAEILEITGKGEVINIICDDEEQMACPMYKIYRKIKIVYPDAREKLKALTFADDELFKGLQAADMISSLMRLEANKRFFGIDNEYCELFDAIGAAKRNGEKCHLRQFIFCNGATLRDFADEWFKLKPQTLAKVRIVSVGHV